MEIQHLIAKLPVDGELRIDPALCVPLFHQWVARQSMPEMLVDVAELLHVPAGPGVIAVGHDADYALDHTDDQWGVLYRRKVVLPGSNSERVAQALHGAARAAVLIEAEFKREVTFSRTRLELIVNDRALAPNTAETFAAAREDLAAGIKRFLGHDAFSLEPAGGDPRRRFAVTVISAKPYELATPAAA